MVKDVTLAHIYIESYLNTPALQHVLDFLLILAYLDLKEHPTLILWSKLIKIVSFNRKHPTF